MLAPLPLASHCSIRFPSGPLLAQLLNLFCGAGGVGGVIVIEGMCASVWLSSSNNSSRTSNSVSSMSSLSSREGGGCFLLPHCRLSHKFSFLFIFLICLSVSGLSLLCSSPLPPEVSSIVFPESPMVSSWMSSVTILGSLDLLYTDLLFNILWAPVLSILTASDTCLSRGES